jgi:hypothetical protein
MKCLRSLEHWDRGFESRSRHGYLSAFIMCLCVGSGLAMGWSLVQGVLPTVLGWRNWSETKRFTDALCSKVGATGIKNKKDKYIHTVQDYRQYSTIAILYTLHFTVAHKLRFSVFTSRILATDFSQSHSYFNSHMKSSWHSLIHFLPFHLNYLRLPYPELDPILSSMNFCRNTPEDSSTLHNLRNCHRHNFKSNRRKLNSRKICCFRILKRNKSWWVVPKLSEFQIE